MELDHLVLAVRDLQATAGAWADALGLHAEPPYQPEGSHLQLARIPMTSGAFLELVAAVEEGPRPAPALERSEGTRDPRPSDRLARFIAGRGEGMFSISLHVDDLDAAVATLRARGLPVSDPEAGAWPGTRLARIPRASAHGVAIQLIERAGP